MRFEIPVLQRFFCCFPLRHGLIAWGSLKLIIAFFLLLDVSYVLIEILMGLRNSNNLLTELPVITILLVVIVLTIADIVLDVTFIKACRQKNAGSMKRFYQFNIFLLVLMVITNLIILPMAALAPVGTEWFDTYSILSIALQAYILVLVRSQLIKLNKDESEHYQTDDVEGAGGVKDAAKENESKLYFEAS